MARKKSDSTAITATISNLRTVDSRTTLTVEFTAPPEELAGANFLARREVIPPLEELFRQAVEAYFHNAEAVAQRMRQVSQQAVATAPAVQPDPAKATPEPAAKKAGKTQPTKKADLFSNDEFETTAPESTQPAEGKTQPVGGR